MSRAIRDGLREFERIDAAFRRFMSAKDYKGAGSTLPDGAHVQEKLRYALARRGAVAEADPQGAETLRRFRDSDFAIQQPLAQLDNIGPDYAAEDWPPEGKWLPDDHLNELFDPGAPPAIEWVVDRLLACQVVISHHEVPGWIQKRTLTVRRCYALGLYDATWVFLRSLIEAASYDWLADHARVKPKGPVRLLAERQQLSGWLGDALDGAAIPASLQSRIRAIVRRANSIVHSKLDPAEPGEAETLKAIGDVVQYLERLYR